MGRYVSKPSEIEAIQFTGDNHYEVAMFTRDLSLLERLGKRISALGPGDPISLRAGVDGAQGWVPVPAGHWIVRPTGDRTHHWPVDPDYFAAKYEPVTSTEE